MRRTVDDDHNPDTTREEKKVKERHHTSARPGGSLRSSPSRKKPGTPHGLVSRANNDGNLATRQSPHKRPRHRPACYVATACVEARGLPDDCYELELLRLFRAEYVARLPDGEEVLADYREKAPRVVAAIGALGEAEAAEVWEDLYERGVARAVALILNGEWDEAYEVYRTICRALERRFLAPEAIARDDRAEEAETR
jgi:hypothetical protein